MAADSLVLAQVIELLGGGVASALPQCPGAMFRLGRGSDFGAAKPETEILASLLLDGERPTGRRASNRDLTLPILITAPSRAVLDAAREVLLQAVDAQQFTLVWTRDGSPGPLVYDCFRATAASMVTDLIGERQLIARGSVTFPALPYGRSDVLTTLNFPSPSLGWTLPPSPVRIDDYSTVSTTTQAAVWAQSAVHLADSFSAYWNWTLSDRLSPAQYTRTLGAAVNITGLTKFSINVGLGTRNYSTWHSGDVAFSVTLTDNGAHTLTLGGTAPCSASNDYRNPRWNSVTFAIPVSGSFNYANVTAYSVKAWRKVDQAGHLIIDSDVYINGATAVASATAPIALIRGVMYQLGDPGGTARSPMNLQLQPPPPSGAAALVTQTFTTPGATTLVVPAGVAVMKVRTKGGSGVGGSRTTTGTAGGAGGGAGAGDDLYPVTSGQQIQLIVGAGGGSGGYPTLAASYNIGQDGLNGGPYQTPSFTPVAGEVIVVKVVNDFYSHTINTPTGGGLTFTRQVENAPTNSDRVVIFTAVVGAGGTPMTVTTTIPNTTTQLWRMIVERWQNAKLAGSPATMTSTGSGAPSGTLTTAANNSIATWVNGDWNQVNGSARAYRSSAVETAYVFQSGKYTWYSAYQQAATAGAQTCGLTTPTGQSWDMVGIEIQALNTGALNDGGDTIFDAGAVANGGGIVADGGKSVPVNTTTGGAGGLVANCSLRPTLVSPQTDFEGGIGTWVAQTNCTVAAVSSPVHGGTGAIRLRSTASGDMSAMVCDPATVLTQGIPVAASGWVTPGAWFRTASSVRTCRVGASFYDSTGAFISTLFSATTASDASGSYTQVQGAGVQGPSNAAYAIGVGQVQGTGAGAEDHFIDDFQLYSGAAWAGGNGANGGATGGGGGSSAGDDAAGANGSGQTGGTAPTGGGNGGNGANSGGNNAGSAGSAPGGGGGGAVSTGGSASGGASAAGKIVVTYAASPTPIKTVIVHAPGFNSPDTFNPIVPVGSGLDTPNGATEYAITSPITGLNARYYGTYTAVLLLSTVNSAGSSRTITATITQYDYPGGPSTTATIVRTLTPSSENPVITNGVVVLGEITLPTRDLAPDQTSAYTTVKINDTNTSDRALDLLLLDVTGQTALINCSTGHVNYFLDAPDITRDYGRVLASDYDRAQATSVIDSVLALSGGPLMVDPDGPGWLFAYSHDAPGAPALNATFYPRWRDARLS